MKRFISTALLCVLASQSGFAQQRSVGGLDRPDPGIGEGFAAALADQFKTAFGAERRRGKMPWFTRS
jgi:hypothetical protein